jgi:hypothetical protein
MFESAKIRTILLCTAVCVSGLHVSCRKTDKGSTKLSEVTNVDVKVNITEFENAGRCDMLEHIIGGYTAARATSEQAEAGKRVRIAEVIWSKVAQERVKRGTSFEYEWTNRLQTRGYIEPMFLADIPVPLKFTGTNHWDYYDAMTVATKKKATEFARRLSLVHQNRMRISEITKIALEESGGDPFKAFGMLGALTIWDRWNAETLSNKNGGNRNQYTVLPGLFADIGEGDSTGQTYHFWGFVALIFANGPEMGLTLGQSTTVGYEVVRNWKAGKAADMEDYDIDNSAMAYAIGAYTTVLTPMTVGEAQEKHKKFLCRSEVAQSVTSNAKLNRACEIWLGNAASKEQALAQVGEMKSSKADFFLHFDDIFQCTVRAKQAPSQYAWLDLKSGVKPNFAFFRYSGGTSDEKTGVMSSAWIGNGIGRVSQLNEETKLCKEANKLGGDCAALRQTVSLKYCKIPAEFRDCVRQNSEEIAYNMAINQRCINQKPNTCVEVADSELTAGCFLANRDGGTCDALGFECASRYCKPSAADFIQCKKDHEHTIKACIAENQHCLANAIDQCVPLKELNQFMSRPLQ